MRFLLSIYQPDGGPPEPEVLEPIMRDVQALLDEMVAADVLVMTSGLQPASNASVVRMRKEQVVVTDGPYVEGKEHVGGFWIVDVEARDAALEWAKKAAKATTLPIEVRGFQHGG